MSASAYAGDGEKIALSMSRVLPTLAAIATTTGRSTRAIDASDSESTASMYSILSSGVALRTAQAARTRARGSRAPAANSLRAASSAALRLSARLRSSSRKIGVA